MSRAERAPLSAREMRAGFDHAFSLPFVERDQALEALLAVRVGGAPYLLRVRDISGFAAARKIVPLPSALPGMLGLAGLRGTVVPVFSLAAWIGYTRMEEARWFVLSGRQDPIALAFADFDGYSELPRALVSDAAEGGRAHVRQVVRLRGELGDGVKDGEVRGVIDVASVVKAIQDKVASARATKER